MCSQKKVAVATHITANGPFDGGGGDEETPVDFDILSGSVTILLRQKGVYVSSRRLKSSARLSNEVMSIWFLVTPSYSQCASPLCLQKERRTLKINFYSPLVWVVVGRSEKVALLSRLYLRECAAFKLPVSSTVKIIWFSKMATAM